MAKWSIEYFLKKMVHGLKMLITTALNQQQQMLKDCV